MTPMRSSSGSSAREWKRTPTQKTCGDCCRLRLRLGAEYETVKRELAALEWVDSNDYADAKSSVVAEIMGRAELWASQTGWSTSPS